MCWTRQSHCDSATVMHHALPFQYHAHTHTHIRTASQVYIYSFSTRMKVLNDLVFLVSGTRNLVHSGWCTCVDKLICCRFASSFRTVWHIITCVLFFHSTSLDCYSRFLHTILSMYFVAVYYAFKSNLACNKFFTFLRNAYKQRHFTIFNVRLDVFIFMCIV